MYGKSAFDFDDEDDEFIAAPGQGFDSTSSSLDEDETDVEDGPGTPDFQDVRTDPAFQEALRDPVGTSLQTIAAHADRISDDPATLRRKIAAVQEGRMPLGALFDDRALSRPNPEMPAERVKRLMDEYEESLTPEERADRDRKIAEEVDRETNFAERKAQVIKAFGGLIR